MLIYVRPARVYMRRCTTIVLVKIPKVNVYVLVICSYRKGTLVNA